MQTSHKQNLNWGKKYLGLAESKNLISDTVITCIYSIFMSDNISGHEWKLKKSEMLRNSFNKSLHDAKTHFNLACPLPPEWLP